MISYIADFIYGASKYPCALFKPKVFIGHFGSHKHHKLQKEFFGNLRNTGFKRTFWQLVFPGQTAGLIKRIDRTLIGLNQYHIRFYEDGVIECELEVSRWSTEHWTGPRLFGERGRELLFGILEDIERSEIFHTERHALCELFGEKEFTLSCIRGK